MEMNFEPFKLVPVGYVRKNGETFIEILQSSPMQSMAFRKETG
jgi:hypothetical protein